MAPTLPFDRHRQSLKAETRLGMNPSCPHEPPPSRQTHHRDYGIGISIPVWGLPENSHACERRKEEKSWWPHPVEGQGESSPPRMSGTFACFGGVGVLRECHTAPASGGQAHAGERAWGHPEEAAVQRQ